MKKLLAVTIGLTLCCGTASAQDWLEALKKTATTAVDNVTGGKLTEMALYGTWTYARPSVRFEGTDLSGDLSGSLLEALLVDQLSKIYLKAGIEAARRAGAGRIVALATTLPREVLERESRADRIVDTFAELRDLDALLAD